MYCLLILFNTTLQIPGFMDMGWIENKNIDEASDEESDEDEGEMT